MTVYDLGREKLFTGWKINVDFGINARELHILLHAYHQPPMMSVQILNK